MGLGAGLRANWAQFTDLHDAQSFSFVAVVWLQQLEVSSHGFGL